MKLWVDDERPAPDGWCWVETSAAAIDLLATHTVTEMSLDYSLGRGDTGDNVLYWLKDHTDRWPSDIKAHSSSWSGCELIKELVERFRPA